MAKRVLSKQQPVFNRSYSLEWECPECEVMNAEEEPNETAKSGDVFQCYHCGAVFIVQPAAKVKSRRKGQ